MNDVFYFRLNVIYSTIYGGVQYFIFIPTFITKKKTYIDLKYFFGIKEAEIKKVFVICRFQR